MAAAAEAIGRFVAAWGRRAATDPEYRPFPDVARRNAWQEAFASAGDVRELPLPDTLFDLVVDFGTCYHVTRRAWTLREVSRVLVAGGRFVHESRLNQLLARPVRSRGR